jgi:hypothetical protein
VLVGPEVVGEAVETLEDEEEGEVLGAVVVVVDAVVVVVDAIDVVVVAAPGENTTTLIGINERAASGLSRA